MSKNKTKTKDERARTNECPNCDIAMLVRWTDESYTEEGQRFFKGYYARCGQCLTIFVLTSDGWEEAAGYARDEQED